MNPTQFWKQLAERSYRRDCEADFKLSSDQRRRHACPQGKSKFARLLLASRVPNARQKAEAGSDPTGSGVSNAERKVS